MSGIVERFSDGFDSYQEAAAKTAKYTEGDIGIPAYAYTALGLTGEAGEVAEKVKKYFRDHGDFWTTREAIKKELGDVLWYLSETARQWGLKLSEVAIANVEKLASRRERGVIGGSGDER